MQTKFSVEKTNEIRSNIHFEIPAELYNARFDQALNVAASSAKIKGFRPGHAPRAMVLKMYQDRIHSDVVSELLSRAYHEAITEHSLRVVGSPNISVTEENVAQGLKFTAEVDLFPEPEIKDYFGLAYEVALEEEELSDEDLQEGLDSIRERFSSVEPLRVRQESKSGDYATIDFEATVDGQPFEGSTGQDVVVELGKQKLPPELDEGLLEMPVGAKRDITIHYDEDAPQEELRGKDVVYSVTLKALSERVLPPLDDELAKKSQLAEDVDGLKKYVRESLLAQRKEGNERAKRDGFFQALADKNPFAVPQLLVDEEIREILFEFGALNRQEQKSYAVDLSKFRDSLGKGAEFRVRRYVMLEQIVKQEEFEASNDDIEKWLDQQAQDAKRSREEINQAFNLPKNAEAIARIVTRELMTRQMLDKANVKRVEKLDSAEAEKAEAEKDAPRKKTKKKKSED